MFHSIHTTTPWMGCRVRSTAACMLARVLLSGRSPPAFSQTSVTLVFAYGLTTLRLACSLFFWSE